MVNVFGPLRLNFLLNSVLAAWNRSRVLVTLMLAVVASAAFAASPPQACRGQPLAGVYHPARLHVMNACVTVSGTVEAVPHEADTDYHINVRLAAPYAALINQENVSKEHGDLVVEIIPMDEPNLPTPYVGEHVTITGAYVLDTAHGWMEVHPAWIINGQGTVNYTLSAAAASVQAGVCGNGDTDCALTNQPPTNAPAWPSGAAAECKDGTFSYSQHHRGACSRHGGVLAWRP